MTKHSLTVEPRKILGKKIKALRKQGILPANIYGKNVASTAIQVSLKDFEKVYKEAKETGIVEINLDGKKTPTLIKNIAYDYLANKILHADFYQVNLTEKVKAQIPVILVGEPKAVTEHLGPLLHILQEVEVEALPSDLPEKIEINVENLAQVNDQVMVSDIKVPNGVEILTGKEETIAKISEPTKEEVVETPVLAESEETTDEETKKEGKTKEETPNEEKSKEEK